MTADIVFLVHNRIDFTIASLASLKVCTSWSMVNALWVYLDGNEDGVHELVLSAIKGCPVRTHVVLGTGLHTPVDVMLHYLSQPDRADVFAKIDSDVIVPPGWFSHGFDAMAECPSLAFLGLEPPASRTRAPWSRSAPPAPELQHLANVATPRPRARFYAPARSIGGVGFMRCSAFDGRPSMRSFATYGGFTDWQEAQPDLVIGWILPPLKLFLLDRLPFEPFLSLSKGYIAKHWQRPWTLYDERDKDALWGWWIDELPETTRR